MKTREEVEHLKRNWKSDPCWDIENTEGFEEFRVELKRFHKDQDAKWAQEHANKVAARAMELNLTENHTLTEYIMNLEDKLKAMDDRLRDLEDH